MEVLGNKVCHVRCMMEIVRGYCYLEHYTINPQKSEEVVLNREKDSQSEVEIKYGKEPIRRSNLLCILELYVVKQVDPISRRRSSWDGGPFIVSRELVSMVLRSQPNGFCSSLEDLCSAKSSLWFRSPNLPPVRHPDYRTAAKVHVKKNTVLPE